MNRYIEEEGLKHVISHIHEGVIITHNEKILVVNTHALSFFFITESTKDCVGKNIIDIFHHESLSASLECILKKRKLDPFNLQIWDSTDKQYRIVNIYMKCMDTVRETDTHILITMRDITELTWLEQIRKDFIANVSHELKTPITAIKGFAETLLNGAIHEPQVAEHFTSIILNKTIGMQNIIEDLLMLSRIEQQENVLDATDESCLGIVHVKDFIEKAFKVVQSSQIKEHIHIDIIINGVPVLYVNPNLFIHVFTNLINNAIQYGGENVCVRMLRNSSCVELCVEDDGQGISQQHLSRLFERFYRVDNSVQGTGLGLAIVKHIVQIHGGTISVTSKVGVGTRFIIKLPQQEVSTKIERQ